MKSHKVRNRLTGRELFLYFATFHPDKSRNYRQLISLATYFPEATRIADLRYTDEYSPEDQLWEQAAATPVTGNPMNRLQDGGRWLQHLCELFLSADQCNLLVYLDLRHYTLDDKHFVGRPFVASDFIDGVTFGDHDGEFSGIIGISRNAAISMVSSGLLLSDALTEPLIWQAGDPRWQADLVARGFIHRPSIVRYAAIASNLDYEVRPFSQFERLTHVESAFGTAS